MIACLCVGTGGFIGAVLRYLAGNQVYNETYPIATFQVKFIGSVVIGGVIAFEEHACANSYAALFLKTGLCGGFTTFSTFSAEVLGMLEKKQYLAGSCYAAISVAVCLLGVLLGKAIVNLFIE